MPIGSIISDHQRAVANEVTEAERSEYRKFAQHHIGTVARALPDELWHYTTAEGLLGILNDGEVFSTQISCLNDSLERIYFGDLVLAAVKDQLRQNTDNKLKPLYSVAVEALNNRNVWNAGYFVTCFSEEPDDLAQWRGYGNGEAGYAIGFQSVGLVEAANSRGALLFPMNYEEARHQFLVREVLRNAELYFLAGLARGATDPERWAANFVYEFSLASEAFACTIKHPKFVAEKERRIGVYFTDIDRSSLVFRAKRTLLARHLPIDLKVGARGDRRLPLTRICVGPGPGQKASMVAVGDLLTQKGYKDCKVEPSIVPYRAV